MPAETENPPVTEQKPAATPAAQNDQKPEPRTRFPVRRPLSEVVREKTEPAKPEVKETKPEPKEPAKAQPEAKEAPKEAPKPQEDTKTAPEATRGSLRAQLAQADPVDEKPKETKAEEPVEDDDDPTLTDKMRRRVNKLKGETAKERTAREAAEKKALELEGRLAELDAKPKITEAQQKEWETKENELLMLRRRYSLESDPEVKRFDTRIEAAKKTVDATIARATGVPEFVRTLIKDAGGFESFLRAGKLYDIKVGDENKKLTGSQIYKHIQPDMDPLDIGTIQTSIGEQNRLQTEKQGFIEEGSKKAKEYFDQQSQTQAEQAKQQETAQVQQAQMFKNVGERITREKWMADEEVPTTGDEDAIKTAKSRNALRSQLRRMVEQTIAFKPSSQDPEKAAKEVQDFYFDVIRDSTKVYFAEHELKLSQARIKQLEAELDGIKNASRTTPRNGSGAATPASSAAIKVPPRESGEGNIAYGMRLQRANIPEAERLAALMKR